MPNRLSLLLIALLAFVPAQAGDAPLRLATTTSTANTGLMDLLLPRFTADTGITVHLIAVGIGKALRLGREGDVDVVLVHARPAEDEFVAQGYGTGRADVMYNDFIIVGPKSDPAVFSDLSPRRLELRDHDLHDESTAEPEVIELEWVRHSRQR